MSTPIPPLNPLQTFDVAASPLQPDAGRRGVERKPDLRQPPGQNAEGPSGPGRAWTLNRVPGSKAWRWPMQRRRHYGRTVRAAAAGERQPRLAVRRDVL
jgi:hypothetical protein